MFRPLELFVGARYLLAKRENHFVSFISLASMLGIAVGVAALIAVLSVMNGFGNELRSRLLSLTAHVTVTGPGGRLEDHAAVAAQLRNHPEVLRVTPFVEGEAMLVNGLNLSAVLLSGVSPGRDDGGHLAASVIEGRLEQLEPGAFRMILGGELARNVGVLPGDPVTVMIPRASGGRVAPRLRRFEVSGLFDLGIAEHDSVRGLVHIADAAALYDLGAAVSGLRIEVADIFRAAHTARELAQMLGGDYRVSDWTREQAAYFRAIRIEKTMMFVILLLIVAVAAFNIVATLVMVVSDKRTDIAILRTLGMRPGSVMRVFVVQGTFIGVAGTLLGVAAGVALALNIESLVPRLESAFGRPLIPADLYYITEVPSDMRWNEVALIALAALLLALVSTLYPARRAARTHPAEALRYE